MRCLVVMAHPLDSSLCATLSKRVVTTLRARGHDVAFEDLYTNRFDAALSAAERAMYYTDQTATTAVSAEASRLLSAQSLVLVFPTWWFSFPAILKGWFDRVWTPGVAFEHHEALGPITPRLTNLREVLAITSLGSPWWVDKLVMREPVKRVLQKGIVGSCAPHSRFRLMSLYASESLSQAKIDKFTARIDRVISKWPTSSVGTET